MTLLKCKGRLYYFAHIPKTGGSSVEYALRKAGAQRALHFHKKLDYLRCNLQHMQAELFDTFIPPSFYRTGFCVVRHPVARLLSEYHWRNELGHVKNPFSDWVANQLQRYEADPYILDNHLRPQHEFIGKKIKVYRFEDGIPKILAEISELTGLQLDVETHRRKSALKAPVNWTSEVRDMAVQFYAKDFEVFDYDINAEIKGLSIIEPTKSRKSKVRKAISGIG